MNKKIRNQNLLFCKSLLLEKKKGIEYSLEAISILKKRNYNIEFRLIGAGDNQESEDNLRRIVKQLKIEDVVKFIGKKAHKETIAEMNKSDIFLHPSVTAKDGDNEGGAPVGIIEASAVGLPVVSTLHADIPEVIVNNRTGYLVEERNSKALADKIVELMNNQEKNSAFGKAGREHIINEYDINILMSKLKNIYMSLVEPNI